MACILVIKDCVRNHYIVTKPVSVHQDLKLLATEIITSHYEGRTTRSRETALRVAHNRARTCKPSHGVREIRVSRTEPPSRPPSPLLSDYYMSKMVNGVFCPTPDLCGNLEDDGFECID